MGSKITIAPGNISYLYDAIVHMTELGIMKLMLTVYLKRDGLLCMLLFFMIK